VKIEFREFWLSDLYALDIQDRHKDILAQTIGSVFSLQAVSAADWAWTCLVDGKVKACIGATRGEIWAFLGKDLKRAAPAMVKYAVRFLKERGGGPYRAWVDKNHPNAIRLVKLIGFRPENAGYWVYP
jgi:hypothetical protein